jgi:SAM-dependent methyltransferase
VAANATRPPVSVARLAQCFRRRRRPPIPAHVALQEVDHPAENALNALAHRQLNNALALAAREHATGRLLDIGCGEKPYAPVFAPYVTEHIGVEHAGSPHALDAADIIADAYDIPLPDASVDTVLLAEVLEHLEEPVRGLREAHRLLAPGGNIILTAPFLWPMHEEPRDFYRYSPFGLRHLLESAGFADVEVEPLSGQWSTLAMFSGYSLRHYRRGPLRPLIDAGARAAQRAAVALDRVQFEPAFSWNHIAVARKP